MNIFELEQDKIIKEFVRDNKEASQKDIYEFFEYHFLHADIETEFTHKVAKNVIDISYKYYLTLSDRKRTHFLKALSKLFDVALSIKMWEYQLSRDDASWYWKNIPTYFLSLTNLTGSLENLRKEIGLVDKKHLHSKIVCVEGEAESNFIRTIYLTNKSANFDFPIYNYQGKNNLQNLVHFIKEKNRQGIKVYLSYDKDRQSDSFIDKIKKKCKVTKIFGFEDDFEKSFPAIILKYSLEKYFKKFLKEQKTFTINNIKNLLSTDQHFIISVQKSYKKTINKQKLGYILGGIMASIVLHNWDEIFNKKHKKKAFSYEIFKFLKFLIS